MIKKTTDVKVRHRLFCVLYYICSCKGNMLNIVFNLICVVEDKLCSGGVTSVGIYVGGILLFESFGIGYVPRSVNSSLHSAFNACGRYRIFFSDSGAQIRLFFVAGELDSVAQIFSTFYSGRDTYEVKFFGDFFSAFHGKR